MKKFFAFLLAAAVMLGSGSVTALAKMPRHDNPDCVLDNVSLTLGGSTYISEGEETIRLDSNVAKFYFNATANILHARSCTEQSSGSSKVDVYYKINREKFVKAGTSSNPSGRSDIIFSDVKIPKSGALEDGDKVTIEFRYDNGGCTGCGSAVTFYVYIGNHSGQPILSDTGTGTANGGTSAGGPSHSEPGASSGTEANPNTGLAYAPAALLIIPAAALIRRRG